MVGAAFVLAGLVYIGSEARFHVPMKVRPPEDIVPVEVTMKTTSYCHCGACCSYSRLLCWGVQRKKSGGLRWKSIGVTASGREVRPGMIAADRSLYPFGTVMYVPGYGFGVVGDTGGAIKGDHIDLYRPSHRAARAWGVQQLSVKVWLQPEAKKRAPNR
jgi:3D (Asp-Asp-Asp) domain-containing protein